MCITEIFANLLKMVSIETEIPSDRILSSSKCAEVVDARCILIKLLYKKGMYPSSIASELGCTVRSVQYNLAHFPDRAETNPMMRINYECLKKQVGNKDFMPAH